VAAEEVIPNTVVGEGVLSFKEVAVEPDVEPKEV
jgi:hypothetical protein